MDLRNLVKQKRHEILKIAARHGASNVRIFGSVARGEADEKSDIDILVTFNSNVNLLDHAALMLDLEALLGCKVDVVNEKGLRPRMKETVLQDAQPL
jgi:uncharacterized protein